MDTEYTLWLPGATQPNSLTYTPNATLTYAYVDASHYKLGLDYLDNTGTTTDLYFNITDQNGTVLYTNTYSNVGSQHILVNYTLLNVRGDGQAWSFNAHHTT
jgi:hypothetical protein